MQATRYNANAMQVANALASHVTLCGIMYCNTDVMFMGVEREVSERVSEAAQRPNERVNERSVVNLFEFLFDDRLLT